MVKPKIDKILSQYKGVGVSAAVEGASPHRLIQMLMAGAMERIATAKGLIQHNEISKKAEQISWAISIIGGLQGALDMEAGGEIAQNLDGLYDYMARRLVEANLNNDVEILDEVLGLLLEIKSAWDVIGDNVGNPSQMDSAPSLAKC